MQLISPQYRLQTLVNKPMPLESGEISEFVTSCVAMIVDGLLQGATYSRIDIELTDHRPNHQRNPHRVGAVLPCQAAEGVPPLNFQFGLECHPE